VYSSSQGCHTATGTHVPRDTVLPATRQRWHSRPYPSWSWYSIKRPRRDARLSWINDRISGERNAIGRVRLSVSFNSISWINCPSTLSFAYVLIMTIARRGFKVKVTGQGERSLNKCMCCGFPWVMTDNRCSKFPRWRRQLRASAARRAAWRSRCYG